jgi:hypothetical protein
MPMLRGRYVMSSNNKSYPVAAVLPGIYVIMRGVNSFPYLIQDAATVAASIALIASGGFQPDHGPSNE